MAQRSYMNFTPRPADPNRKPEDVEQAQEDLSLLDNEDPNMVRLGGVAEGGVVSRLGDIHPVKVIH